MGVGYTYIYLYLCFMYIYNIYMLYASIQTHYLHGRLHMASSFVWIESFTAVHLTSYFQKTGNQNKRSCELDFELSVKQHSIRARFLSLARNKLRLCSANHRAGYFSNLACDWLSIVWAYSEQETENGPRWALSSTSKENLVWCAIHQFDIPLYRSFLQQSSQQLE